MRRTTLIVLVLLVLVPIIACDMGDFTGEPAATVPAVVIPDTTKVLPETTTQQLSSISEDGSVFVFSKITPELEAVKPGDVIVGDTSPVAPFGFLRRVTAVQESDDQVVVETIQATLEEAIEQGTIRVSRTLTPNDVRTGTERPGVALAALASLPELAQFVVEIENVVLADLDGDEGTTDDQVVANGRIAFEQGFDFELTIDDYQVRELTFTSTAKERAWLEISSQMELANIDEQVEIARYVLHPITVWVGWLPVVLTPVLTVNVALDGSVTMGLDTSVTQEVTLTAGLSYANGSWQPIGEFENEFEFVLPTISASCHAKGHAGPQLTILIYGVVGPSGEIDGYLEFEADIDRVPACQLYGGLEAKAGVELEIVGVAFAEFEATVIDYRVLLAECERGATETAAPTPFPATPTSVAPTCTPLPSTLVPWVAPISPIALDPAAPIPYGDAGLGTGTVVGRDLLSERDTGVWLWTTSGPLPAGLCGLSHEEFYDMTRSWMGIVIAEADDSGFFRMEGLPTGIPLLIHYKDWWIDGRLEAVFGVGFFMLEPGQVLDVGAITETSRLVSCLCE